MGGLQAICYLETHPHLNKQNQRLKAPRCFLITNSRSLPLSDHYSKIIAAARHHTASLRTLGEAAGTSRPEEKATQRENDDA